ncbi:TetR/AcrR family transcriptional regulator [Streptomyces sp. LX-29]|uniref:TetR/AcrR family transcriptional regulator n=1 Tax=Streptomyces sp. LX-29 TaxID=2900152 RepID=UPI00240CF8D9|nr:TetR/AcrR family transcriptional regulator [Streptomyces sp. LX-29]WFB07359.1 TetR/AcrR family transcriptional regulator [Streptomyces sp. LX-29]
MDGRAHTAAPRTEGLRERKKRQTRQHISDVATGLFLERGFDAVTIAEIADVADVSVNTVYNYFPAKEDLFFDRQDEQVNRLSRAIEGREVGESAAHAVLRALRTSLEEGTADGLDPGFRRFMEVIKESTALSARILTMQELICQAVGRTLREETGADEDDPLPMLIASQLSWVSSVVVNGVLRLVAAGGEPEEVARTVLGTLDTVESLLGERTLNYAVKNTP